MSETENPQPLLTLELDTGEREFADTAELTEWLNEEKQAFKWIGMLPGDDNIRPMWENFRNRHAQVAGLIRDHDPQAGNQQKREFVLELQREAEGLMTSESADAQFVFRLHDERDPKTAAYALKVLLQEPFSSQIIEKKSMEGLYRAWRYLEGSTETVESHRQSLESLKKRWAGSFSSLHKEQNQHNKSANKLVAASQKKINKLEDSYNKAINLQQKNYDELVAESQKKLDSIENTYDQKLALQSSVNYWTQKYENHQKKRRNMALITFFVAAVSFLIFFTFVYCVNIPKDFSIPDLIRHLSIISAISTFGIWLTRLCTKIFVSHLHLRTDAQERVTMIQTYLALLREDNVPKDEERRLILQTLFRPSTAGFIKEDGPHVFHETILKEQ